MKTELIDRIRFLVNKADDYLVAVPYEDSKHVRWSRSPFDGYRFEYYRVAKSVANRVGGTVRAFDPICGDILRLHGRDRYADTGVNKSV